jgi:para-nitrobenzyl esterase
VLKDPIQTDAGPVLGTILGQTGKEVRVYRGIPYAAPPIGKLRWKSPQPVEPWDEVRECVEFKDSPVQLETGFVPGYKSEDCLYLNVLTPARSDKERLPVMVWFHGGGYSIGAGNQPLYNTQYLPQHGAVLVSVNHRLGPIGLLALPALSKESPDGVSGNYLFLDLLASLQWVQRNIAAFGGDPTNVTIFGESGGGAKVDALMASPLAKSLFHRAVCQSGTNGPLQVTSLAEAESVGERLAAKMDISSDNLRALRAVPAVHVVQAALAVTQEMAGSVFGGAGTNVTDKLAVDGWFMPEPPWKVFAERKQNDVPFIVVVNLGELLAKKSFLVAPQMLTGYLYRLQAAEKVGGKGYAAIFSQVPSNWKADGVLANHGLEVPYVFGYLPELKEKFFFETFEKPSGARRSDPGLTEEDGKVAEAMMTMWIQFAKKGAPSVKGLVDWPAWRAESDQYLDIAWPLQVKPGYSKVVPGR